MLCPQTRGLPERRVECSLKRLVTEVKQKINKKRKNFCSL
jgi:hypothetical protein